MYSQFKGQTVCSAHLTESKWWVQAHFEYNVLSIKRELLQIYNAIIREN